MTQVSTQRPSHVKGSLTKAHGLAILAQQQHLPNILADTKSSLQVLADIQNTTKAETATLQKLPKHAETQGIQQCRHMAAASVDSLKNAAILDLQTALQQNLHTLQANMWLSKLAGR